MTNLIDKLNEKYSDLNRQITAIREQMTNESKQYIEDACKELFDACPEVHQIHWTQYSPYFNDGEECYFSVNDVFFVLTTDLDEDGEWEDGFYEGSRIYTQKDIDSAVSDLKEAVEFDHNPDGWRKKKYGTRFIDAKEREARGEFRMSPSWQMPFELTAKPWPSDVAYAEQQVDEMKKHVAAIGDRGDIIKAYTDGVIKFIHSIDADVMESLFGNHVSVVITREGMEIDEYDHD